MTNTTQPQGTATPRNTARREAYSRLIVLILIVEIAALGLKAWHDHRVARDLSNEIAQRESVAVSAHADGRLLAIEQVLRTGLSARGIADLNPNIEAVTSLADALSADPGTRLHAAGEAASLASARDWRATLTSFGDVVVVSRNAGAKARLALVQPETVLPSAAGDYSFALAAAGQTPDARAGKQVLCTQVASTNLQSCVLSAQPSFGRADMLNLLMYGALLLGPTLAIVGLLGLIRRNRDDTERLKAELAQAGRMLATAMQEAKAGFWTLDTEKRTVWLSAEAAALVGAPESGTYPISAMDGFVHPQFHDKLRRALVQFAREGELRLSLTGPDHSRWFDMRGHAEHGGKALAGIILDTTEMRIAIARSRRAEQRLQAALEGFSGPFALWDSRHRLIFWNQAFAEAFNLETVLRQGMSHHTVALAQSASITDRRPDRDEEGVEIVRVSSGTWLQLVERETATGGMITMGLDVSANVRTETELLAQRRKLETLVSELQKSRREASELADRLREEKVRAENSANSKSAFLANMSHELRTPLNAINGFSEILLNEMYGPLGDPRYREYARDILASGHHLLDMINDILDMAKIEAGKMTVDLHNIDLIDPVDAAVRMIRRKAEDKGVRLTLSFQEDLPRVDADHRAIRQMILNLVSNAIKFTDEGGAIHVAVDRFGGELRVTVQDTGIGIPEEALPRLAEPFEQVSDTRDRNYDGTGLGLALTKSFAEMHGGRLDISSKHGEGTKVCFFLPIPRAETDVA